MIDTPPHQLNRPEPGLTWAEVQAESDAARWFACLCDCGPTPTAAEVRAWYERNRGAMHFAESPDLEPVRPRGWTDRALAVLVLFGFGVLVWLVKH